MEVISKSNNTSAYSNFQSSDYTDLNTVTNFWEKCCPQNKWKLREHEKKAKFKMLSITSNNVYLEWNN